MMTDKGTFIVNGIERVMVNQLVRSPGHFSLTNAAAPAYFNCKIIPKRGAWLEIETDKKGIITAKVDRKRKIPITQLLRILDTSQIKDSRSGERYETFRGGKLSSQNTRKDGITDIREAYQSVYRKIRPGDMATAENAKSLIESMFFDFKRYDLGPIARHKFNKRFGMTTANDQKRKDLPSGGFCCHSSASRKIKSRRRRNR